MKGASTCVGCNSATSSAIACYSYLDASQVLAMFVHHVRDQCAFVIATKWCCYVAQDFIANTLVASV